ncbi:LysR family transcriptional regulator [Eubacteriaceae bacterium ES2]|nr:LysR family transcriptional regulator [Eubacteriaceae bacterium ES2]
MRFVKYRNIRIHQIQIFLSAADCANFTAAAEQMNVTQPMVSKTIQLLEQELDIILFRKDHGKLFLTPAGRELKQHWKNVLEMFEQSVINAHSIQEAKETPIRFGLGMSSGRADLRHLITDLMDQQPPVELLLECDNMANTLKRISEGDLDLGVCSGHLLTKIQSLRLNYKLIAETSLSIFIPTCNPLTQNQQIAFPDLRNEAFIAFSPESDPLYWELLNSMANEAGFIPKVACYVKDELSFQINLEMGRGIVMADSGTPLEGGDIKKYILAGTQCNLFLVWRGNNSNPGLIKLLNSL